MRPDPLVAILEHTDEASKYARERYARAHDQWAEAKLGFMRQRKVYDAGGAEHMAAVCRVAYIKESPNYTDPEENE